MRVRVNTNPTQYLIKLRSLVGAMKTAAPNTSKNLDKIMRVLEYQFQSAKPVNQCLEQLAQAVWILHKLPDKLAYKHQWMLSDPEVRQRLNSANYRLDQNHLRKAQMNAAEVEYNLNIKKLLSKVGEIKNNTTATAGGFAAPMLTTMDIEDLMNPIIFRQTPDSHVFDIYNYYDEENVDKKLRSGNTLLLYNRN